MQDKNKLINILDTITIVCGTIALILQLMGGVDFSNPFIWLLVFLITSAIASFITRISNNKKKSKK